MRWLMVLLLAVLAPAFAADTPAPGGDSGQPERPQGYAVISVEDLVHIAELQEQHEEILRLRDRPGNQTCI